MKKLIIILTIAVAMIACEKIEQSHVLVYDMQELSRGDELILNETRVISFRTDNENVQSYIDQYQTEPVNVVIDDWVGKEWTEVRVYGIN